MKLQVDGREAYAYTGGRPFDPALPVIVFVHGAVNDHSVFTLLARWFAHHGHSVLALDLPGHMRSAGAALAEVSAMARWALALLDAAGVERAAWVGHSMGSLVALAAAAQAPARATQLVMVGTCLPMSVPKALLDLSLADPQAAIDRTITFEFSTLAAKPSYPGPGSWLRGSARAMARQVLAHQHDVRLFHTDFAACDGYRGGLDDAARVRCPATLLLGRHDQMTPVRGTPELAAALRAGVHVLDAGHYPMLEQPDATLALLRTALAANTVAGPPPI